MLQAAMNFEAARDVRYGIRPLNKNVFSMKVK
jgi:hypothetical protein